MRKKIEKNEKKMHLGGLQMIRNTLY